jgi:hypothetical protein
MVKEGNRDEITTRQAMFGMDGIIEKAHKLV